METNLQKIQELTKASCDKFRFVSYECKMCQLNINYFSRNVSDSDTDNFIIVLQSVVNSSAFTK